jgi:hypothetical protein
MFAKTAEDYHCIPPVLDFPVQALNPSRQRSNPLVYMELTAGRWVAGCVCVCVCVYAYTYIHTYVYTYIHTYVWIS